jgi:hypothetical protein
VLELLEAGAIALPATCDVSGSYFVQFTVYENGRVGAIKTPVAPSCLTQALTAWVATFRYSPPVAQVESGIEWMLVTAKKGS